MNRFICPRESDVVHAAKSRQWTEEFRAHVAGCLACKETVEVAATLQDLTTDSAGVKPPISYRVIWMRAQVARREERLSKLDRFMILAGYSTFVLALLGSALWKWDLVESWISAVPSEPGLHLPLYIVVGCAAFLWFLAEELFSSDF
jgi:hypothetical protein